MISIFDFETEEERLAILADNAHLRLIEEQRYIDGNHLIFTDEPLPEPLVFTASPPGAAIGQRLTNIEDFLKEAYPE